MSDAPLILSASSIGVWMKCEYQYLISSVWKVPGAPNMAMAIGTAVHAGAEALHQGLDPVEATETTLARQIISMPAFDGPEATQAALDAHAMLELYRQKIAPTFHPTMIERAFVIRVGEVLASGQIDAADEVSDEVHDTKTTATLSKFHPERHRFQLSLYGLAYRFLTGRSPKRLVLDVIARNGKWKSVPVEPDYGEVSDVLTLASRGIMSGEFRPTGVDSGQCARCPYLERECSFGRVD